MLGACTSSTNALGTLAPQSAIATVFCARIRSTSLLAWHRLAALPKRRPVADRLVDELHRGPRRLGGPVATKKATRPKEYMSASGSGATDFILTKTTSDLLRKSSEGRFIDSTAASWQSWMALFLRPSHQA